MTGHPAEHLLLVDVGNTRLKWCVCPPACTDPFALRDNPQMFPQPASTSSAPDDAVASEALLSELAQQVAKQAALGQPVRSIRLACVGAPSWSERLSAFARAHGMVLSEARSTRFHRPLWNDYTYPETLGVDRFVAALAVTHLFPARSAVIVSAGTATTIDALDAQGHFLGGYIVPGSTLMASSLHRHTARLPQVGPQWAPFPATTEQAISSGIMQAQAGAVRGMLTLMRERVRELPLLILTGGGRDWLRPVLPEAFEQDDLVLKGLALWHAGSETHKPS